MLFNRRVKTPISSRKLTAERPGSTGVILESSERRVVCPGSKGSRRSGAFVRWFAEVCAWILARQKVIDRPISRAERMALVLRITRFIGMPMKPAWHARCHPSPCAGLCIFSTGMQRLSVMSFTTTARNPLRLPSPRPIVPRRARNKFLIAQT